ncbi:winged helix-turn-helix transcriptional regulator [Nocardia sp. 2YAB30]|uniref:winged helix-turn-helix transcriptional regulator n=1 Tax=unclassified Nocardia TaxID=2637762 RepID=UPI003F9B8F84
MAYRMRMGEPLSPDMFDELCPSSVLPLRVGDKWGALILECLSDGPRRYSELRIPLHRVTPKVFTQSLRTLERDGLISRHVDRHHVSYALTELGRGLLHPIDVMSAWVGEHWNELVDAREAGLSAQRDHHSSASTVPS